MRFARIVLVVSVPAALAACADNSAYERQLREALDQAEITLIDAIDVGEAETAEAVGVRAALLVGTDPVYSVETHAAGTVRALHIDIVTGAVLSASEAGAASSDCAQAIALTEALSIAEARVGGEAVAVVWDDDEPCAREIQVLTDPELMEVKVAASGRILEVEESDEDGGIDDD